MSQVLIHQENAPEWLKQLFHEIDTLEFGSGFAHLSRDTEMQFGTATIRGLDAIKEFFVKIDSPLEIRHRIHDFWEGGTTKILRGDAVLRKKGSTDDYITTPLMQILYMGEKQDEVVRWFIVNGPIKTDSVV
jgi:hypothetical protein